MRFSDFFVLVRAFLYTLYLYGFHPVMPFIVAHLFDGVAEGCAGHLVGVLVEEIAEEIHGDTLAHFAEHPAYGFVHEVVGMVEVLLSIAKAPRRIALLRCLPRTHHAHALFPEVVAVSQGVEQLYLIVLVA